MSLMKKCTAMKQSFAGGLLLIALASGHAESTSDSSAELATAVATIQNVPQTHYLDGAVEAVKRSTVSAQTSGQIQEINFDVDDFVQKDQVILRIKDTQQRTALEQARAQFKQAQADLDRIRQVFERGVATQAELDKAETAFSTVKAALDSAQEQLDYTVVKAPYTGIVTERHVQPGEIASSGMPLMSGISLEELRVNVNVPQSLINKVREYNSAFILSGEGELLEATKITIFPYADMSSNTFKVRLDLPDNGQKLFPGMYVKAGFFTGTRDLLMVPSASVVYRSEVTGIYVVSENGKISLRHIRVGKEIGNQTVILAGLEPGELVAIDPVTAGVQARQSLMQE